MTVALGYCHPGQVEQGFAHSLLMMCVKDAATTRRIVGVWPHQSSANISHARNAIVREFLANPVRPDWLLMLDADMTFADDLLDQLVAVADPAERPIIGGLCFGVRPIMAASGFTARNRTGADILELFPTVYGVVDDTMMLFTGYPHDSLVEVNATGAACLLVHRSVFDAVAATQDEGHPLPWFRETVAGGKLVSEDHTFCVLAQRAGFPIHVHTGIRLGHVKKFVADEARYFDQRAGSALDPVAVLVPSRRPQHAAPFMASLRASTPLATVYVATETQDVADAWRAAGADVVLTDPAWKTANRKVNALYAATKGEAWLFGASDDIRFEPRWYDIALHVAKVTGCGVVGVNDLANPFVVAGEHATHALVARSYIEEQGCTFDGPGTYAPEAYWHNFADNEIVGLAKSRGQFATAGGAMIRHLHPQFGTAPDDGTHAENRRHMDRDRRILEQRAAAHFGKTG